VCPETPAFLANRDNPLTGIIFIKGCSTAGSRYIFLRNG
jgi:hypothetical protein